MNHCVSGVGETRTGQQPHPEASGIDSARLERAPRPRARLERHSPGRHRQQRHQPMHSAFREMVSRLAQADASWLYVATNSVSESARSPISEAFEDISELRPSSHSPARWGDMLSAQLARA